MQILLPLLIDFAKLVKSFLTTKTLDIKAINNKSVTIQLKFPCLCLYTRCHLSPHGSLDWGKTADVVRLWEFGTVKWLPVSIHPFSKLLTI